MKCGRLSGTRATHAGSGMADHHTGKVLAYVFGRRKDEVFLQLKALLSPSGSPAATLIIGAPHPASGPRGA